MTARRKSVSEIALCTERLILSYPQLFEASFCASSSQSICAQLRREIPATPKWEPHAFFLIWNDGSQVLNKVPSFIEYVSTREDAERYGLTFARKWIDDGKPPLGDHLVPISKRL